MNGPDNKPSAISYAPLPFGILSLLLLGAYSLKRWEVLHAESPDSLLLARLHLVAAAAAILSIIGLVLCFIMRKNYYRSKIFLAGAAANLLASVWGFLDSL